jgi:hypothetical protein
LNQDGRAPISTHPASAHKHAALQNVPKNGQASAHRCPTKRRHHGRALANSMRFASNSA